jgi:hypothetical protein
MSKLWTPWWANPNPMERFAGPLMLGGGILMELLGCVVIYKICDIEV